MQNAVKENIGKRVEVQFKNGNRSKGFVTGLIETPKQPENPIVTFRPDSFDKEGKQGGIRIAGATRIRENI